MLACKISHELQFWMIILETCEKGLKLAETFCLRNILYIGIPYLNKSSSASLRQNVDIRVYKYTPILLLD